MNSNYLQNKVKEKLYLTSGDIFETIAFDMLNFSLGENIQQIHANVEESSDGDGGIDLFDVNSKTWYSVYGQEPASTTPQKKLTAKIGSDFDKVVENRKKYDVDKWVFVCNRKLGANHHGVINKKYDKNIHGFKIGTCHDLEKMSALLLDIPGGKNKLYDLGLIDEYDNLLELRKETLDELKDLERPKTMETIVNTSKKTDLSYKLKHKKIGSDDIEYASLDRLEYLTNYIPLLLDGGAYSQMLPNIEAVYRGHINQDKRGIKAGYKSLENFEEFIIKAHNDNKEGYNFLQDNSITKDYLLKNKSSQKGCFYQQLANDYYSICDTSEEIQLKIIK